MAKPTTKVEPKPAEMGAGASEENKSKPVEVKQEPAVMAAGASEENAEEDKGAKPAETKAGVAQANPAKVTQGFRDDKGHFTGNPPTVDERLDAICDLLEHNGWSLPKILQRDK